jgi:acyl dehydratase
MQETENRWEFDAVEIGQEGTPVSVAITDELIDRYARSVRNDNPAYRSRGDSPASGQMEAMPTMVFRVAPLRRADIASNNGYTALEVVNENPRQTPFAKCEMRWFSTVKNEDVITSKGRIFDKYDKRGNKFVVFRVEGINQNGVKVCEYDYTCVFEYRKN